MYRAFKFRLYPDSKQKELINKTYKDINKRIYKCSVCGYKIDRDLNASINILDVGLKLFMKEIYKLEQNFLKF